MRKLLSLLNRIARDPTFAPPSFPTHSSSSLLSFPCVDAQGMKDHCPRLCQKTSFKIYRGREESGKLKVESLKSRVATGFLVASLSVASHSPSIPSIEMEASSHFPLSTFNFSLTLKSQTPCHFARLIHNCHYAHLLRRPRNPFLSESFTYLRGL